VDTGNNRLNRNQMERRRLEAATELLQGGVRQADLVEKFGISRTTASRWYHSVLQGGKESLRRRKPKGRPSLLSGEQWNKLEQCLRAGARRFGYPSDDWTTSRLSSVIQAEFGVAYQTDHVRRLRRKLLTEALAQ
jgi:transposase